jgi:hypothetical protein
MSIHTNLFTHDERLVLSSWLTVRPADDGCPEASVYKASTRLGFAKASLYSPEAAAVATIAHDAIQQQTPPYRLTASVRRSDGSLGARQSRAGIGSRFHRKLSLLPYHLFTIDRAGCRHGGSQTCAYHLIWLPLYEAHVVTATYKAPETSGYEEVAIGHFGPTNAASERATEVIAADWRWHRERGQDRWGSVWSAGMIGERQAKELAGRVWGED